MVSIVIFLAILSALTPATVNANNNIYNTKQYTAINQQHANTATDLIIVNIAKQNLQLFKKGKLTKTFTISTSKKGPGQQVGSRQTPIGLHKICEKIGEGAPQYGIFKGRKFTGSIWPKNTPRYMHRKDFIVTRILRLEGLEPGINKGQNQTGATVDSKTRAIYIHGTTMEWKLGFPSTIGCIHMSSKDVIKLFNEVSIGTLVLITT